MSLGGAARGSASQAECRGFESLRPLQPKPRPCLDLRALATSAKCNGGSRVLTYALDRAQPPRTRRTPSSRSLGAELPSSESLDVACAFGIRPPKFPPT